MTIILILPTMKMSSKRKHKKPLKKRRKRLPRQTPQRMLRPLLMKNRWTFPKRKNKGKKQTAFLIAETQSVFLCLTLRNSIKCIFENTKKLSGMGSQKSFAELSRKRPRLQSFSINKNAQKDSCTFDLHSPQYALRGVRGTLQERVPSKALPIRKLFFREQYFGFRCAEQR